VGVIFCLLHAWNENVTALPGCCDANSRNMSIGSITGNIYSTAGRHCGRVCHRRVAVAVVSTFRCPSTISRPNNALIRVAGRLPESNAWSGHFRDKADNSRKRFV